MDNNDTMNFNHHKIMMSYDTDTATTAYINNNRLIELKKVHADALIVPSIMNQVDYGLFTELMGTRTFVYKSKPNSNSHPIAANLQAIAYQRCIEHAKLHDNQAIDIGGTPLRTPDKHHLCSKISNIREDSRYVNAHVIRPEGQLSHLHTIARDRMCLNGAEYCNVVKPYAYAINVYDIKLETIAMIFNSHNLVQMDMWMFMPLILLDQHVVTDQTYYKCQIINELIDSNDKVKLGQSFVAKKALFSLKDASNAYKHDYETWRSYYTHTCIKSKNGAISIEIIEQIGTFTNFRFTLTQTVHGTIERLIPMSTIMSKYVIVPCIEHFIKQGYWIHNKVKDHVQKAQKFKRLFCWMNSNDDRRINHVNGAVYEQFYISEEYFVSKFLTYAESLPKASFTYETMMAYANANKSNIYYEKSANTLLVHKGLELPINVYSKMIMSLFILAAVRRNQRTQLISETFNTMVDNQDKLNKMLNWFSSQWHNLTSNNTNNVSIVEDQDFNGLLYEIRPIYFVDLVFNQACKVEYIYKRFEYIPDIVDPFINSNAIQPNNYTSNSEVHTINDTANDAFNMNPKQFMSQGKVQDMAHQNDMIIEASDHTTAKLIPVKGDGHCGLHTLRYFGVKDFSIVNQQRLDAGWLSQDEIQQILYDNDVSWTLHINKIPQHTYRNKGIKHININYAGGEIGGHWSPIICDCEKHTAIHGDKNMLKDYMIHHGDHVGAYKQIPINDISLYINDTNSQLTDNKGQSKDFREMFPIYDKKMRKPVPNIQILNHDNCHIVVASAPNFNEDKSFQQVHEFYGVLFNEINKYCNAHNITAFIPLIGATKCIPMCCFKHYIKRLQCSYILSFMNNNLLHKYNDCPPCTHAGYIPIIDAAPTLVNNQYQSEQYDQIIPFTPKDHMRIKFDDIMHTVANINKVERLFEMSGAPGAYYKVAHEKYLHYDIAWYDKSDKCNDGVKNIFQFSNDQEYIERVKILQRYDIVINDVLITDANVHSEVNKMKATCCVVKPKAIVFKIDPTRTTELYALNAFIDGYIVKIWYTEGSRSNSGEQFYTVYFLEKYDETVLIDISEVQKTRDDIIVELQGVNDDGSCNCKIAIKPNANVIISSDYVNSLEAIKDITNNHKNVNKKTIKKINDLIRDKVLKTHIRCDVGVGGAGKTMNIVKSTCKKCTLMISPYAKNTDDVNLQVGNGYCVTFMSAFNMLAKKEYKNIIIDEVFAHNPTIISLYRLLQPYATFYGTGDEKQIVSVDWQGYKGAIDITYISPYKLVTKRNPRSVVELFKSYIDGVVTTKKEDYPVKYRDADDIYTVKQTDGAWTETIICFTHKLVERIKSTNKNLGKINVMTAAQAHGKTIENVHLYLADIDALPKADRVRHLYTALSRTSRQLIIYGAKGSDDITATITGSELERSLQHTDVLRIDTPIIEHTKQLTKMVGDSQIRMKIPEVNQQTVVDILTKVYKQVNDLPPNVVDVNLPVLPENKTGKGLKIPLAALLPTNTVAVAKKISQFRTFNRLYVSKDKLKTTQTMIGRYADKTRSHALSKSFTGKFLEGFEKWLLPNYKDIVKMLKPDPATIWRYNVEALIRLQAKFPKDTRKAFSDDEIELFKNVKFDGTSDLGNLIEKLTDKIFDERSTVEDLMEMAPQFSIYETDDECVPDYVKDGLLNYKPSKSSIKMHIKEMLNLNTEPNKYRDLETPLEDLRYHKTVNFMMKQQPKNIMDNGYDVKNKYGQGVSAWSKMINMICAANVRYFDNILPHLCRPNVQISYGASDRDLSVFWTKYATEINNPAYVKFLNDFGQFDCTQEKRGTMAIYQIYRIFGMNVKVADFMIAMRASWKMSVVLDNKTIPLRATLEGNWEQHSGQIHTLGANTLYNMAALGMCFDFGNFVAAGFKGDDSFIITSRCNPIIYLQDQIYKIAGFKFKIEKPLIAEYIANIVTPMGFVPDLLRRVSRIVSKLITDKDDWDKIKLSMADSLTVMNESNLGPSMTILSLYYKQKNIDVTAEELSYIYFYLRYLTKSDYSILKPATEHLFINELNTIMTYFDRAMLKANTPNGKDWLEKYLHPPTAKGQSYNGYPDKSVIPCIHAEYRLAYEGRPLASKPDTSRTCVFLSAPGVTTPMFYADSIDTLNTDNEWIRCFKNTQVTPRSISDNMARVRMSYASDTFQYDVTAFSNNGMVYGAQFYPPTYTVPLVQAITMFKKHTKDLTHHYKAIAHHYGADVAKQVAYEVAKSDEHSDYILPNVAPTPVNLTGYFIQVVKLGKMVRTPSDVTMLSPKSYQSRSTEGAFVVKQCIDDVNSWSNTMPWELASGVSTATTPGLMMCAYEQLYDDGTIAIFPFRTATSPPSVNPTDYYIFDIEWPKWSWSYTFWTGLDTTTINQQINIKYIAGFEITPQVGSILNSQAMSPALYDPTALDTAAILTQSRQDCMPASMNELGDALSSIAMSILDPAIKCIGPAISGADGKESEKKEIDTTLRKANTLNNEQTDVVNESKVDGTTRTRPPPRRGGKGMPIDKYIANASRKKHKPQRKRSNSLAAEIANLRRQISGMRARSSSRGRSSSRKRSTSRRRAPFHKKKVTINT